ncbi:GNAT family N-acetyltransferase [uncultured Planktosalinus sp.]|uniref:GNAT family N-acetyltransferase n=1 Tax=uncultured Planktosalinus sp. TaxID=1810935 RepID=UPI0030DD552E
MKKEFPLLKTERLLFRQITIKDLKNVFNGLSNPGVIQYYGISFKSLDATKEQINWFADLEKTQMGIWWAICSLDNKTFFGSGGLSKISQEHKKAEIGFWLLPEFWGRGIMTEALPAIYNYGFKEIGLHRIEGFVESENKNCKKALSKLDFQYEGTMIDCEIKNGKFISVDIFAKIVLPLN